MLVLAVPNVEYVLADVSSLKQNLPVSSPQEEQTHTNTDALPSFLESSTGVGTSQDIGLTGSGDPTVPLSYTNNLTSSSLENDLNIYGVNLTKEEKEAMLNQANANSGLDSTVSNNMTDNSHKTSSVDIILTKSLADFCNY